MKQAPSIFDSFNARFLNPELIAQTFVPSAHFDKLAQRAHSLVVGPRGSGKTSLLKMLQTTALENWGHPSASAFRRKIDFSAVFIASDIAWKKQLDDIGLPYLEADFRRSLCLATFTTHVLHALVQTFIDRRLDDAVHMPAHRRVNIQSEAETAVVRELAKAWSLQPSTNSFVSLKHALSLRLNEIWEFAAQEEYRGSGGRRDRFADCKFLHLHFLKACSLAIELFDDAIGEPGARWALLFDELELAPEWILEELIDALRSLSDQKLLIKLSLSPFNRVLERLRTSIAAAPGHDFNEIPLWYAHKEEGYRFSEELFAQILKSNRAAASLEDYLGLSVFESSGKRAYTVGSRQHRAFVEAFEEDPSFRSYIRLNNININQLAQMQDEERASLIRKIYPTLVVRNFFRRSHAHKQRQSRHPQRVRSVKRAVIYGGKNAVLAMLEGNPRWIIGLATNLSRIAHERASKSQQVAELNRLITRFRALLKTIAIAPNVPSGQARDILKLLDAVGNCFYEDVVLADFTPEPHGSFIVDSKLSPALIDAIGAALNAGAIVYVPDNPDELLLQSVRGKRFRLTYLFSAYYHIPVRLGAPVALQRCLKDKLLKPEEDLFGL